MLTRRITRILRPTNHYQCLFCQARNDLIYARRTFAASVTDEPSPISKDKTLPLAAIGTSPVPNSSQRIFKPAGKSSDHHNGHGSKASSKRSGRKRPRGSKRRLSLLRQGKLLSSLTVKQDEVTQQVRSEEAHKTLEKSKAKRSHTEDQCQDGSKANSTKSKTPELAKKLEADSQAHASQENLAAAKGTQDNAVAGSVRVRRDCVPETKKPVQPQVIKLERPDDSKRSRKAKSDQPKDSLHPKKAEAKKPKKTEHPKKAAAKKTEVTSKKPKSKETSTEEAGSSLKKAMSGGKVRAVKSKATKDPFQVKSTLSLKEALTAHGKANLDIRKLSPEELDFKAIDVEIPPVPKLSHALDRVLFNPGVYRLQDPRSRVYNFDPYLEKIMPAQEFDFSALSKFMTSSEDKSLINLAKDIGARYTGSTSSLSGALSHFHYLLSSWRPLNLRSLSRQFPAPSEKFTKITTSPSAIFLRWKNGTYAIDSDKQFDTPNIMSWLGNSLEMLLTKPAHEFEKYRKSNPEAPTEDSDEGKSYHYSQLGNMLVRSQLDAHDPRLPGSGVFDVKTRAVVTIRMEASAYEQGVGYQLRHAQGEWESFEREFYDMTRSTMLKYSLQVRMGRMDGIFVAYHNIERLFGFQYISLPDMDSVLHGQNDTCLGDQEFKMSIKLLSEALERATQKYPEQSIRLHFETREADVPFMYIFAEPVTEARIKEIQNSKKDKVVEFERSVIGLGQDHPKTQQEWQQIQGQVDEEINEDQLKEEAQEEGKGVTPSMSDQVDVHDQEMVEDVAEDEEFRTMEEEQEQEQEEEDELSDAVSSGEDAEERDAEENSVDVKAKGDQRTTLGEAEDAAANETLVEEDANDTSLDEEHTVKTEFDEPMAQIRDILGMVLTVRNNVNGQFVKRPENLTTDDSWSMEYHLDEMPARRANNMYAHLLNRRRKALQKDGPDDKAWEYFRTQLRAWTEKGREWRKQQDAIDEKLGTRIYTPLGPVSEGFTESPASAKMDPKVELELQDASRGVSKTPADFVKDQTGDAKAIMGRVCEEQESKQKLEDA